MAIEFNDNIHVKINRPTDFRFGPFESIAQANSLIPIAQRYHGLIFGVYTDPLDIANSDVDFFYYYDGLTDVDYLPFGGSGKPPIDGDYVDQAAMIAAQANQTAQYIYYDGENYWEYLGTTNGDITDYRQIGSIADIYESVTFADVQTLISSNSLIPGKCYLINDFQTIHRIPNTTDINTGPTEPLMSIAISNNQLSSTAWSTLYPKDQIQIDWTNTVCEDGITPRKGKIERRFDPIDDVIAEGYDWRHVKFRRWKIIEKRKEVVTSITASSFNCPLTVNTYLPAALPVTSPFYKQVSFASVTSHDAGALTITVSNGTYSYTRPLLKYDNTSSFSANELVNKKGQLVYCGARDAFVFMYQPNFTEFGDTLAGNYIAITSASTWSIGHELSYSVDPNDYVDYYTFQSETKAVRIGDTPSRDYPNNVFVNQGVYATRIASNCYNNTMFGQFVSVTIGDEFYGNVTYLNAFRWSTLGNEIFNNIFCFTDDGSIQDVVITNTAYNCSFFLGRYSSIQLFGGTTVSSQFYQTGNVYTYDGLIEGSLIYLAGDAGGEGRTHFFQTGGMRNVLLGWFYARDIQIMRHMRSEFVYEVTSSKQRVHSLNISNIASGTPVSSLGITAEGDVVPSGGIDLAAVADNGNISPVVLKHPDGVAPEDSATVGQLQTLENNIEASINLRTFGIDIDGAGNPIVTGIKGYAIVPYNCEILAWYIVADTIGSIEIDVWKAPSIPTGANSICGADRPKLVSAQENQNETLTTWSINVTSGDVVAFNVVSASTVTKVNLIIKTKVVV